MGAAVKEKLIGARIPMPLKEMLDGYCKRHGMKMNFFVVHAIRDKLLEAMEDEDDVRTVAKRLKEPEFVGARSSPRKSRRNKEYAYRGLNI